MLRKLLRFDFRAVLKYWWIAAISLVVLALAGGGCIAVLESEKSLPSAVEGMAVIGLVLSALGFFVLYLICTILVFVRFYKNFFTDEGYLTFTLPVKRSQLLNSKLIMSVSVLFGSMVAIFLGFQLMMGVGLSRHIFTADFWQGFSELWEELVKVFGAHLLIYFLEALVLSILSFALYCLVLFNCITFASIITRKAKVLAAIGIYYAVNSVISFVQQLLFLFTMPNLVNWLSYVPEGQHNNIFALLLLGLIVFLALICMLLYCLEYWMLDRKLNLN